MGLLDDAKKKMDSTDMDDKAKAKVEEMRRKHAESELDSEKESDNAA